MTVDSVEDLAISHHFVGRDYAKVTELDRGQVVMQHVHAFAHDSALLIGIAQVRVGDSVTTYHGPALLKVPAGEEHEVTALTDCLWVCLWPNPTGETDPDKIDERVIHHG